MFSKYYFTQSPLIPDIPHLNCKSFFPLLTPPCKAFFLAYIIYIKEKLPNEGYATILRCKTQEKPLWVLWIVSKKEIS